VGSVFVRSTVLFAFWLVLIQSVQLVDLFVGALTVALATRASLYLLPPDAGRVKLGALALRLPRFLWQSVRGGIDVARRAFDPRVPLAPGLVTYQTGFPRGHARIAFASITSLLPGTAPVEDDGGSIVYHCLDTTKPVLDELAAEERAYAPALVPGRTRV
jgi:multicomponent Na+:H+ antiporter subunit E